VELVTTFAQNLSATPDRPQQTFDEIENSKVVQLTQCDVNDVRGHQIEITLGTNSTFREHGVRIPCQPADHSHY
jgi:hypothetical protein